MKITKRKFKAVLCAILSVCVLTFSAYPVFAEEQAAQEASTEQTQATTIDPNDIDALESRRQELQAQSDKYQQILEKTKENIADQEEYVKALVSKVQVLDDKIELSHQSINELNGKIQDKQAAIDDANKKIEDQMNTLRNRLRNIYMAGNTTDLEIIFGAKSFSDFLDKMELVEALSDYDNNLINSIKGDLENISKEKAELEKELLKRVNMTGVGPSGLGGSTTAVAVNIEYAPTHIGGLPIAVNLNCHAARRAEMVL